MQNTLLKREIILIILGLLICINITPSTGRVMEQSFTLFSDRTTLYVDGDGLGNYSEIHDAIDNASLIEFELSAGLAPNTAVNSHRIPTVSLPYNYPIMWGYIVNSSVHDEGTCYFNIEDPSEFVYLQDTESDDFLSGGTGIDGKWIACENSTGALWEIDPETGNMTYIGGGGVGLNGLTFDLTTNLLFGASGSGLYIINKMTGEQELIGYFGSGVNEMIGIASNGDGEMYGWDLGDKLWIIDKETGEATEIGPLGIDLNYAQDGNFDWGYNILYLTAFIVSPYYGSYLCCCNLETGECWVGDQIGGNSQITASVISLGWWVPHDVGINKIVRPENGTADEDMEVIVQVTNYEGPNEKDVPVNVIILKDGVYEEYNETVYIDIEWKETIDVEMPVWTPDDWHNTYNEHIDYKITAYATVWDDDNPDNDYKEKWIELYYGYFHDVGCTGINSPESGFAQTFPVTGHIKNLGQYEECCFKTYVEIAELDTENQVELLSEDFTDSTFPPDGWTRTHDNWKYCDSNKAGGLSGEARFYYLPKSTDLFRLYTSPMNTSDYDTVEIEFRQFVDHYTGPYILQVETSNDGINWDVVWNVSPSVNIGPETVTILTGKNVGSTTYVSWTFNGYSWNIDSWYIDDIVVNGYNSFDPEYEDYQCTTTIEPGEELELEFDEWTPEFLAEETTGTKKYLVKAWTDMDDPPDENPDNDLFSKSIILDFFHDVAIYAYSPAERDEERRFYAVNCSGYPSNSRFVWFDPEDLDTLHDIGKWPNTQYPQGGTFVKDVWWVCDTTGNIWTVNLETGEYESVGNAGTGELVDLAYHEKTDVLYGASSQNLYMIDMDNGKATYIGPFQQIGYYMISMDCDKDGVMYGCDLNYASSHLYTIDLDTGKATIIGQTGVNGIFSMSYDTDEDVMWIYSFDYGKWRGVLYTWNIKNSSWTFVGYFQKGVQINCLSIPYKYPPISVYIPPGIESIEAIAENVGTFPEQDMTCYAEIYEYITNCTNGTLVYEDIITDIDIPDPLWGTEILTFDDYNFVAEGFYVLILNLTHYNDDYPGNNLYSYGIGCDDTPPVTWHELDPPEPDGENGWYVNDLNVTFYAEDPIIGCGHSGSGIKEIKYTINGVGDTIPGSVGTFTVIYDGNDIVVEYWAIDWVGNIESKKSFTIDMDQTLPVIDDDGVHWEAFRENPFSNIWYVRFWTNATDATSDMDRVEMYINEGLHETSASPDGARYDFVIMWSTVLETVTFSWRHYDRAGWYTYDEIQGDEPFSKSYSSETRKSNQKQVTPLKIFSIKGANTSFSFFC